jgi:hypothetical protein
MAVTNAAAHSDQVTITTVKSVIVQVPGEKEKKGGQHYKLFCPVKEQHVSQIDTDHRGRH